MQAEQRERYVVLDGLRGWGALAVVLWHIFVEVFPYNPSVKRVLACLVPLNGMVAVYMFFVISGFSLSIGYVRRRNAAALARMAVSRYPRLALPILAASSLVCLLMVTGVLLPAEQRLPPLDTALRFHATFSRVLSFSLFNVFFRWSRDTAFIIPLWTMSFEMWGSILVMGLVAVFGRTERRLWIYLVLFFALGIQVSLYALFVAGVILAELSERWRPRTRLQMTALAGLFVLGWLGPWLSHNEDSLFYFLTVIGLCAATLWLPRIRAFYETRLSRFLGHISFPLYLVHAPILMSFSLWLWAWLAPLGWSESHLRLAVGLSTVPVALLAPVAFAPVNDVAITLSRRFGTAVVRGGEAAIARRARRHVVQPGM